jgi:TRAP-type C4-dicarboxylate transport system substrate-binding protein
MTAIGVFAAGGASAQTKLTLAYAFPDQLPETALCKEIAAEINAELGDEIQVEILPFNTIPTLQQPQAVRQGRVDMACTSSAYYSRILPENAVFWTSNKTAEEVRQADGQKMMQTLSEEVAGLALIGWMPAGGFRFYLQKEPSFTENGLPDFSGLTVRDVPVFSPLIDSLGGARHSLPPSEVFPALESGIVQAAPWTTVGMQKLGWNKFLKFIVTPSFFQTDNVIIMNAAAWGDLEPETQAQLRKIVASHEESYAAKIETLSEESDAELKELGLTEVEVKDPDAYLQLGIDLAYEQMRERIEQAGRSTDHVDGLKAAFTK